MKLNHIYQGDALEILKTFPDNYIDTVITDPPYGLSNHSEKVIRDVLSHWLNSKEDYIPKTKGFMGKSWDAFVPPPSLWKEVYRVMKPGATALVFAGSRTQDLMSMSMRLAGFEIKDTLMWLYGSGFPKATDIAKQFEKQNSPDKWENNRFGGGNAKCSNCGKWIISGNPCQCPKNKVEYSSSEAKLWDGYKSHSLKPAYEPIIMAIKPNEGSYADNALKWGVAGLNIDETRIPSEPGEYDIRHYIDEDCFQNKEPKKSKFQVKPQPTGRFPANILLECTCDEVIDGKHANPECPCYILDEQSGVSKGGKTYDYTKQKEYKVKGFLPNNKPNSPSNKGDKGGASRFFYCAKASKRERNMGLEGFQPTTINDGRKKNIDNPYQRGKTPRFNAHPTVKPLKLMEYLVKLTSMPNPDQIYLDPFLGSGTTAMACKKLGKNWIGIELDPEYCKIAEARIKSVQERLL